MLRDENDEKNFDITKGGLFFSNSVEVLFEHLKANLFSEVGTQDIFAERFLIVPSFGIQQWLHTQLASSLSISCGLSTTFLNKGIDILCEKIFLPQKNYLLPTQLELFLAIEHALDEKICASDAIWQPLIAYINGKEKRKIALAKHLTQLFERYGLYGNRACLEWEKQPKNWQEALWAQIFQKWCYPQRAFLQLKEKEIIEQNMSVHLFAFSHMSRLYFDFFLRCSRQIPVYFYQLSPCQEFWSDTTGNETFSLLENLGTVGKKMAKLIEEEVSSSEESYIVFGGNTQLKQLQRDLLTLQHTQTVLDDDSIQIHISSTPLLEIENLYQLLCTIMQSGYVEPKDIIVMAPEIAVYAPYIQALFGKNLPFQIADMPAQKNHCLAAGFFLLLDLEKNRWSAPAVLELFDHPLFRKKQKFSEEDLMQIRTWVHQTGIKWAVDEVHRAALLKKRHCSETEMESTATWLEGLGYLVEELALANESPRIDFTQAELLGNVYALIRSLYTDLLALDTKKTLQEWTQFFKKLLETYFSFEEELDIFSTLFEKIEKSGRHFSNQDYSFSLLYSLLKDNLAKESVTLHRNLVQAIHFCSMLPMRTVPAKVICLIGMNHDAFPRKEELQTLDLLKQNPKSDYCPSRLDFDRYLFLEALLSAREKLIISYLGQDPVEMIELPPSSIVAQIMPLVSKKAVVNHPAISLASIRIDPVKPFAIRVNRPFSLPTGEYVIDAADLTRLSRSSLSHFLYFQDFKLVEKDHLKEEECFTLSALNRAILRKTALFYGEKKAMQKAKTDAMFPIGMLGTLSRLQFKEEIASLPNITLKKISLKPFQLPITSSLSVTFTGTIEGVFDEGLCVPHACDMKGGVKAWPLFLLLNACDSTKKQVLFAGSNEKKDCFFEDPSYFLRNFVEFFFYAKECALPLICDWVEPLLEKDVKKLHQMPIYDAAFNWQLKFKQPLDEVAFIEEYHPLVKKLYQEMKDAWF